MLAALFAFGVLVTPPRVHGEKPPATNQGVTFTVTNTSDSGPGSLRAAILQSNGQPPPGGTFNQINFALPGGAVTITLTSGELALTANCVVTGPGASQLTVTRSTADGTPEFRIFHCKEEAIVTISGLTVSGGYLSNGYGGGAATEDGALTVSNCIFSGNFATDGGGLACYGNDDTYQTTLTVVNCTVTGNTVSPSGTGGGICALANYVNSSLVVQGSSIDHNGAYYGAGIGLAEYSYSQSVQIAESTISNNQCYDYGYGGGISINGSVGTQNVQVANCTVFGNQSPGRGGGGVYAYGDGGVNVAINNSTLTANSATYGAGIDVYLTGPLTLNNTIVSDNASGDGTELVVPVDNGGSLVGSYDLIGTASGNGYTFASGSNDLTGVDPMLTKDSNGVPLLQANGGPTLTVTPLPNSPAIDQGKNSVFDSNNQPVAHDQRGIARPVRYSSAITLPAGGDGSDIGAVEVLTASQTWRQLYFGSPANSGNGADLSDPDHDGVVNLIEYATGTNPTLAGKPPGVATLNRTNNTVAFTYDRVKSAVAEGILFQVEWTDDLTGGTWSTAGVSETTVDDTTVQHVTASVPGGSAGHRFVRLRVTRP